MRGGDGIIAGVRYPMNAKIFNNTFINAQTPYNNGGWVAVDTGRTTYGPDTEIRNNIVCDSHAGTNSPSSVRSHNAYFNVTSQHSTNPPSETGRQTGATCPVIDKQGGNFSLTGATDPGVILASPYNSDARGAVRGADGVWDRGALEYR